jgi:hypothetical protein
MSGIYASLRQAQIIILEILQCIPACPVGLADRTGVVIILAFLDVGKNISFSDSLHGRDKGN